MFVKKKFLRYKPSMFLLTLFYNAFSLDYGQQLEIKERIGAIRASGIPVAAIEHFVLVRQLLQVP